MRVLYLFFSLCLLAIFSCKKENQDNETVTYQIFNVQNSGLATNFVTKIAVDNNSIVWIGTFDKGLVRYDGNQWTTYNTLNSPLPNDSIKALTVDITNKVWIGTNNGLALFDHGVWKVYKPVNSRMRAEKILSLCSDSSGRIWAGGVSDTATSGLYSFDGSDWQFYNHNNSMLPTDVVTALATGRDNRIWIGIRQWQGRGGLVSLSNNTWKVYSTTNSMIKYNDAYQVSIATTNKILVSSPVLFYERLNVTDGYLQEFDGVSNWKDISPFNPELTLTNRITASTYDKKDNVWLATSIDNICSSCEYALSRYDGKNWLVLSPKNANFPRTFISDIKADKDNNIWVAAPDVGLIKLTQHN